MTTTEEIMDGIRAVLQAKYEQIPREKIVMGLISSGYSPEIVEGIVVLVFEYSSGESYIPDPIKPVTPDKRGGNGHRKADEQPIDQYRDDYDDY